MHTDIQNTWTPHRRSDSKPITRFNERSCTSASITVNITIQTRTQAGARMMQMLCNEYHTQKYSTQNHIAPLLQIPHEAEVQCHYKQL